jgi:precorrin-2/cobalt-factor-2 C20-methyltransferase
MGTIICVGLGPGDPDLMSRRAARLIEAGLHVAYFRKAGQMGQARRIVEGMLRPDVTEYPMEYPVTTEIAFACVDYNNLLASFYDDWADRLCQMAQQHDVIVLCEGDPFLYGSFIHLHARLQGRCPVEVVPGIPGMTGCWNATGHPVTCGDDVLAVLPGTLPESALVHHMQQADALVIMKTGRNLPKIRRALAQTGLLERAWLIERGTMPTQRVIRLAEAGEQDCPYFAIVLVPGNNGRRPERRQKPSTLSVTERDPHDALVSGRHS